MKTIRISDASYRALIGEAILPFHSTRAQQASGAWLVPVEDDTYERLQQHRLPGESDDDLIQRIIRGHPGRPSN